MSVPYSFLSVQFICACGAPDAIGFDVNAKNYSRTRQCPKCGQILEIRKPIILDGGKVPFLATGDSLMKGESR